MAEQPEISHRIQMPPAYIVGDKPNENAFNGHSSIDNSVRSRNIQFDPVEIVGSPPQIIEMPPLEINLSRPNAQLKESAAVPSSRATFFAPSSEPKPQQTTEQTEVTKIQVDKTTFESPQMESTKSVFDLFDGRQNWSDVPFDDHTEGERLPKSIAKPKQTKRKGKKKKLIILEDFEITGKKEGRAVKTKPKTEERSLTVEALKKIVSKIKSDSSFKKQIEGNLFENLLTIPHSGIFRNYVLAWINIFTSIPDKWGNPKYPPKEYYDPSEEETKALVCDGIHETIAKILQSDPEINSQFHPEVTSRTASRLFGNFSHTAIKIYFEGNEYVLDYWMRLEYDNPMIYRYDDWYNGNDSKGIEFYSIIDNIRNNNLH